MKLLVVHPERSHESIEKLMAPFSADLQVDPYETTIAIGRDQIRNLFGYIFKAQKVFANAPIPVLTEVINEWFDNDESELFICDGEELKQISNKNPQAKYYKWHIDYESLKNANDEYVETVKLSEWKVLDQFREEYHQGLFYWLNHDHEPVPLRTVALHEALTAMAPHAILVDGEWINGPQSDIFDMDLIGIRTAKMRSDMHFWIQQISTIIKPYKDTSFISSAYYR